MARLGLRGLSNEEPPRPQLAQLEGAVAAVRFFVPPSLAIIMTFRSIFQPIRHTIANVRRVTEVMIRENGENKFMMRISSPLSATVQKFSAV
jgi:hypothetical protein